MGALCTHTQSPRESSAQVVPRPFAAGFEPLSCPWRPLLALPTTARFTKSTLALVLERFKVELSKQPNPDDLYAR
jgi:hypothetical protein